VSLPGACAPGSGAPGPARQTGRVPELIEVEAYRRLAEAAALGRPIAEVVAPDSWWLKGGLTAEALTGALVGRSFTTARRTGKRLLLETDKDGPVLGLRFGMTGRLIVDGVAGVETLQYSSSRDVHAWDRLVVGFGDGGALAVRDPRRLGGAELDPDEARLGPDAASLTQAGLVGALAGSRAPLKARLMDQQRISGLGNLLVDEILFRAGLDPLREAGHLDRNELRRLHRWVRRTLADLSGSHAGHLGPVRQPGAMCPLDGTPLVRRTIGGRTTWSCPRHQR
jgi:formamidopyrimidine-DNA glycosylase